MYPVSEHAPEAPAPFPWETILQVAIGLLVGGGGGAVVLRQVQAKARTALQIACDLADANAQADDDKQVELNKMVAAQRQRDAGVHALTQRARGRT